MEFKRPRHEKNPATISKLQTAMEQLYEISPYTFQRFLTELPPLNREIVDNFIIDYRTKSYSDFADIVDTVSSNIAGRVTITYKKIDRYLKEAVEYEERRKELKLQHQQEIALLLKERQYDIDTLRIFERRNSNTSEMLKDAVNNAAKLGFNVRYIIAHLTDEEKIIVKKGVIDKDWRTRRQVKDNTSFDKLYSILLKIGNTVREALTEQLKESIDLPQFINTTRDGKNDEVVTEESHYSTVVNELIFGLREGQLYHMREIAEDLVASMQ